MKNQTKIMAGLAALSLSAILASPVWASGAHEGHEESDATEVVCDHSAHPEGMHENMPEGCMDHAEDHMDGNAHDGHGDHHGEAHGDDHGDDHGHSDTSHH